MPFDTVSAQLVRLVESASDELARLDALCTVAPPAVAAHLRLGAVAQSVPTTQPTPSTRTSLVAAAADPVHTAMLAPALAKWLQIADTEERRARSGAPLTAARVLAWSPGIYPSTLDALNDALRPGSAPRAVLLRALTTTAILRAQFARKPHGDHAQANRVVAEHAAGEYTAGEPTTPEPDATQHATAELLPALMLCAAGPTDRLRLLPFAALDPTARAESLAAWSAGDEEPFAHLALSECARAARAERQSVAAAITGIPDEDARLDALGRAAITARRALAVLRQAVGVTVPSLASDLECSRPAASDALERLVELQLAQEITGRRRDRVYIWSAVHRPA